MRGSYYLGIILTIIKVWRDICRVSPHIQRMIYGQHDEDSKDCREIIVPYLLDIYYIYYIYQDTLDYTGA